MRYLLVLIVVAIAACGGPSQDNSSKEEMETAADGLQESVNSSLEKAQGVEDVLQDAAEARDAAIDEADDET
jgi:hypothetical protein